MSDHASIRVSDELGAFEKIIQDLAVDSAYDPQQFAAITQATHAETERVKKAFIREAFGLFKEKKIERYIQYHQAALVHLIDMLIHDLPLSDIEDIHKVTHEHSRIDLIRFIYRQLEDLLIYIEKHFAKYFNQAAKTPESYRFIVLRELRQKLPDIRYQLEKKRINKRLLSIVIYPLDRYIESVRAEEVSYRRIIYLRQLLTELTDVAAGKLTGDRLNFKLCLSLGYLNFNSHRFFKYCVHEITHLVQDQETLPAQIEKLSFMLKIVNQVQTKPDFILNEKLSPIKHQLSVWLGEEIYFFEKRQQLSLNFPANAEEPVQKDFKLKVSFSVAQLGCFLRGLKDLGIIRNNNVLEVIQFIASVTQSKNTETISSESLRQKFYHIDDAARENVKDLGMNLFNHLRKM